MPPPSGLVKTDDHCKRRGNNTPNVQAPLEQRSCLIQWETLQIDRSGARHIVHKRQLSVQCDATSKRITTTPPNNHHELG